MWSTASMYSSWSSSSPNMGRSAWMCPIILLIWRFIVLMTCKSLHFLVCWSGSGPHNCSHSAPDAHTAHSDRWLRRRGRWHIGCAHSASPITWGAALVQAMHFLWLAPLAHCDVVKLPFGFSVPHSPVHRWSGVFFSSWSSMLASAGLRGGRKICFGPFRPFFLWPRICFGPFSALFRTSFPRKTVLTVYRRFFETFLCES